MSIASLWLLCIKYVLKINIELITFILSLNPSNQTWWEKTEWATTIIRNTLFNKYRPFKYFKYPNTVHLKYILKMQFKKKFNVKFQQYLRLKENW